ncbi:MAG: T9SS type A sorting domain-containing protein [Flavobacteriales bacterium]
MKKTLLSLLSISLVVGATAQNNTSIIKVTTNDVAVKVKPVADGSEIISGPVAQQPMTRSTRYTTIGTTVYDLQSNGTSQRRILNRADKTISATWTMDNGATPYTNRGAGYNYYNGTSWGANPTSKVETTRNGWPAIAGSKTIGNEIIISHSGTGALTMNKRNTKGTGAWTESLVTTTIPPTGYDVLWPRAVVGGANDSTIHALGIVRHSSFVDLTNPGGLYKGLATALVYYRSKDLGQTWDIKDYIIPGLDSSFFTFVSADAYSIDSRGNTVAVSVFNSWGDVLVFKSTDNGSTWTKTIVSDFPINKYVIDQGSDIDTDPNFDTIESCDGSGSVVIDNLGKVHVFYGIVRVLDADTTDGNTSYFPGTNGLAYWTEAFGADSTRIITGALDADGNGTLDVAPAGGSLPSYQVGLSSMPTCGVDANNVLYLAYCAITETHSDGTQNYRHIYVMNSHDGGMTWSDPEDYTPDFEFAIYEAVYPSMATLVDSDIHITYQRDFSPGQSISGDNDPASVNDIIYLKIDTMLAEPMSSIDEISNEYSVNLFPNPTTDLLNVRINSSKNVNDNLNITLVDAIGRTVSSFQETFSGNAGLFSMDVANLENGVYFIRVESNSGLVTKTFVKK